MTYLTPLQVEPIIGTNKRKLLSDFYYIDEVVGFIKVPKGFITDFATIPKIVPRWIINRDSPAIREASVVHDYLYSGKCTLSLARYAADAVLYRAMLELRAPYILAKIVYFSARLFGASHWRP